MAADTYADPGLTGLRAPAGDARSLAAVLADRAIGGFDVDPPLIDQATDDVKEAIEGFFAEGRPQDLLLLYLSGHGVLSPTRRLFFATTSTKLTRLRATAIEDSFIHEVMKHCRARTIVLVLDCCHSGAFTKGLVPKSAPTINVEQRFYGRGRVTLTASTELQYAFEEAETDDTLKISELGTPAAASFFTRYLVEGLRTGDADLDRDGLVSVDELYDYVYDRMRDERSDQSPGKSGTAHGPIIIAKNHRHAALPPDVRKAIDTAVSHPFAAVRETAVSELSRIRDTADPAVARAIDDVLRRTVETGTAARAAPDAVTERVPVPTATGDGAGRGGGDSAAAAPADANPEVLESADQRSVTAARSEDSAVSAATSQETPAERVPAGAHADADAEPRYRRRRMVAGLAALAAGVVVVALEIPGAPTPERLPAKLPTSASSTIKVGADPRAIAIGDGSVWIVHNTDDTVSRISASSGRAIGGRIRVGHNPFGIAIGAGSVWVTNNESGTVSRVDESSGKVVGAPIPVGRYPIGVAVGQNSVWVANSASQTVTRINATSGKVMGAPIGVGAVPIGMAVGDGSVWVANYDGDSVSRIDAASGKLVGGPTRVPAGPIAVAVALGDVWVAGHTNTISRIDIASGKAVGKPIHVGNNPVAFAVGDGGIWVVNYDDGTLTVFDSNSGRRIGTIHVGGRPSSVAVDRGSVWTANSADGTVSRISL